VNERFRFKFGLILTVLICICIMVFRYDIVSALILAARGEPAAFSLRGLGILPTQNDKDKIEKRLTARLRKQDPSGLELYELDSANTWIPAGSLSDCVAVETEQNQNIYENKLSGIVPGDVVLDVGAHIGLYARHALKLGASKIVAIEPVPINLKCLQRNLKSETNSGRRSSSAQKAPGTAMTVLKCPWVRPVCRIVL
jgi:hypothetical protein